jgi:hypothetical protein
MLDKVQVTNIRPRFLDLQKRFPQALLQLFVDDMFQSSCLDHQKKKMI